MPSDLASIALKCLEKEPAARYASAAELASDLRRYLASEPTVARPLRWNQRTLRWARRRPLVAGLLGIIAAGAVCLIAVIAVSTARLSTAIVESERRGNEADLAHRQADREREAAEVSEHRAVASQRETQRLLYDADVKLADEAYRSGNPREAFDRLQRYLPSSSEPGAEDLREFSWRYLWHRCHHRMITLRGHSGPVLCIEYLPDGAVVATAGQDGTIRLWEAASGNPTRTFEGHRGDVNSVSVSPDGRLLASASVDGTVRIWDVAAGREIRSLVEHASEIFAVQFSPTGGMLAAGGKDGLVRLWDTNTWKQLGPLAGHADFVESLAFAPDGKTLASAGADSVVCLWDLDQLKPRARLAAHCGAVYAVRFSPAGGLVAAGGQDGQWIIWNAATAVELRRSCAHTARLTGLAFSPDGGRMLTASRDRSARLWDVASGKLEAEFDGHTERLWHIAFSPDGASFATASSDGTAKLCNLSDAFEILPQYHIDRGQIAIDDQGTLLAASRDGTDARGLAICEGDARQVWQPDGESATSILTVGLDPTGSAAAAVNAAGELFFWTRNASWRKALSTIQRDEGWPPALSPGGGLLAVGKERLQVFETNSWQPVLTAAFSAPPTCVEFSHDGRQLVAGTLDGRVAIWRLDDEPQPRTLPISLAGPFVRRCFSPDDRLVALGGDDGRVLVVEAADGRIRYDLVAHTGPVDSLAFSRDGVNLATVAADQALQVWDLRTGRNLLVLNQPADRLQSLVFSLQGEELVGCLSEGQVVRWTAPRGSPVERRAAPLDPSIKPTAPSGQRDSIGASPRALPLGAPLKVESLRRVFERFAELSGQRQRIIRPTFYDREDDQGLLLGALVLPGAEYGQENYNPTAGEVPWLDLVRNADTYARQVHHTAGYPLLRDRRPGSIALLAPDSFERRDIAAGELGDIDTEADRFREVHRWAKSHGFAGGFPTFVDGQQGGETIYGAVLVKAGFGQEVFLPASSVWQVSSTER